MRILIYGLVLVAALAMLARVRPAAEEEDATPDVAAAPQPVLRSVEGLVVEGAPGRPPFRAARAQPVAGGGPITLSGAVAALELERVAVPLTDGLSLEAETGRIEDGRLVLERVRVRDGERTLLIGGAAIVDADRVMFAGLVALRPGAADARVELDLTVGLDELSRLARGR